MPRPSDVQIGPPPPPARGGPLSPPMPPPTSTSLPAVKFLGWAFAATSMIHRSGRVYESTGFEIDAVNANFLPSGLNVRPPANMSSFVSNIGWPPADGTE